MSRTIFRACVFVGALVLVLCTGLFFILQYVQTEDETYAALNQEAEYAEQGLMV